MSEGSELDGLEGEGLQLLALGFENDSLLLSVPGLGGNGSVSSGVGLERLVAVQNAAGVPLLIAIGLLGNALCFTVLLATHLRLQSSFVYLAFLNVADCGFLACLFLTWLKSAHVYVFDRQGWCQGVVYLAYIWGFLSPWTVVSFTVERYIIVFYPLKKHKLCTPRRVKLVLLGLTLTALTLYSFATWTTGLFQVGDRTICMTLPKYLPLVRILDAVDSITTQVIPSIVIILLNVSMMLKICDFVQKRQLITGSTPASSVTDTSHIGKHRVCTRLYGSGQVSAELERDGLSFTSTPASRRRATLLQGPHSGPRNHACLRRSYQLKTTRALVIVSSVFVMLNLPSYVFRLYVFVVYLRDENYIFPRETLLWQQIFQFLHYVNFAVNVFLYSACSRSFRAALRRLGVRIRYGLASVCAKLTSPFRNVTMPDVAFEEVGQHGLPKTLG